MKFFRKTTGGSHSFRLNGKRKSVKYGEIVECEPEDLGSHIDQYELVNTKKNLSPLEQEVSRLEFGLREKSIYIGDLPENGGLWQFIPNSVRDLETVQIQKTVEMGFVKDGLEAEWRNWQQLCEQDPLQRLDLKEPKDHHLQQIARLQALSNVLADEIEEIKQRIKSLIVPIETQNDEDIERKRWKGVYRCNADRQIVICDGRKVIQGKNNEPIFEDDGTSVKMYLEEVKSRKRIRNAKNRKRTRPAEAKP